MFIPVVLAILTIGIKDKSRFQNSMSYYIKFISSTGGAENFLSYCLRLLIKAFIVPLRLWTLSKANQKN